MRSQPSTRVAAVARVVEVPGHHLGSAHPQLAGLAVGRVLTGRRVDDAGLGAGHQPAHGAGRGGREIGVGDLVRAGGGLGHPVALPDEAAQAPLGALGDLDVQRGRAADPAAQ